MWVFPNYVFKLKLNYMASSVLRFLNFDLHGYNVNSCVSQLNTKHIY